LRIYIKISFFISLECLYIYSQSLSCCLYLWRFNITNTLHSNIIYCNLTYCNMSEFSTLPQATRNISVLSLLSQCFSVLCNLSAIFRCMGSDTRVNRSNKPKRSELELVSQSMSCVPTRFVSLLSANKAPRSDKEFIAKNITWGWSNILAEVIFFAIMSQIKCLTNIKNQDIKCVKDIIKLSFW